jgi:6-pyruvoyltetrahydropterin/6-carboxytetrahydropterin synthase
MSRWVIHAQASFDAHHALTSYRGERERSHGHPWKVSVRVGADELNEEGYALDFHQAHDLLAAAIAPLDRSDLNNHPEIGKPSPTAERVAEVLAERLAPDYSKIGGQLLSVSVWEGPDNRVDLILDTNAR